MFNLKWLTLKSVYRLENIPSEHQFDEKKSASDLTASISTEDIPSRGNKQQTMLKLEYFDHWSFTDY